MRLKRKNHNAVFFHYPKYLLTLIKENKDGFSEDLIEKLNSCNDDAQQINIFKEVLRKSKAKSDVSEDCISILIYSFLKAPLKSSQKKSLNRIILDLHEQSPQVIESLIQNALQYLMQHELYDSTVEFVENTVNCLIGLLDNFHIGSNIVERKLLSVLENICRCTEFLSNDFNQNSIEQNNTCQMVLKAIIFVFQKCDCKSITGEDCNDLKENIKKYLLSLLQNDTTNLNCRLNAGIAYCYFSSSLLPLEENIISSSESSFQEIEKFPIPSQLCIFSGIMAVMPVTKFIKLNGDHSVAENILQRIISISECTEDTDLLLLCTRDLIQWTNILCSILKLDSNDVEETCLSAVKNLFSADSAQIQILFDYVLHYRGHYIDTIRHLSKDLFKNMLNIHLLSISVRPEESIWIKKITLFLLNELPEFHQGKYGLLSCIVQVIGSNVVLCWCPNLPNILYQVSREPNLITHVSDLLEILFRKYSATAEDFETIWLRPLISHLCDDSKEQVITFNEHVLPKLYKAHPSSIQFLLNELSVIWEQNKGHCFSALISCVKLHQREKTHKNALDCISESSLKKAFYHVDDQVRLSAFALICENQKTTEPIPSKVFDLITFSLPYNINCQSPSFRQQLIAALKKLFNRMAESSYSLEKKTNSDDGQNHLTTYKKFISWLWDYSLKNLFPGANFPRRGTALNILHLLDSTFSKSSIGDNFMCKASVLTLVLALQDTYENNKQLSLNILCNKKPYISLFQNKAFIKKAFDAVLMLASSTKPPDTVTAAYMFSLLLKCETFKAIALTTIQSQIKARYRLMDIADASSFEVESSPEFVTLVLLSGELLKHLQLAEMSLLDAAAYMPIYGILICIKKIISDFDFSKENNSSILLWHSFVHEMIYVCSKLASVVEPVVSNSSPEGHLPMDTTTDNILLLQSAVRCAMGQRFQSAVVAADSYSTDDENVVLDIVKTHAVTAQILLLCCWRTHKEISLLFGEMCEKIPIKNKNNLFGILEVGQIAEIGKYFIYQMTLVKHRGAFEQAYVGFSKLCHTLWRCPDVELKKLPKLWLNDLLSAMRGQQEDMQLCPTRRSAGLPFIIQAILMTEPDFAHSVFFKETISTFLNMAFIKSEEKITDEEIHALNILRALFRDACLSEVLVPFISEAMKISITGFNSKSWAVRNSSTLLFSSLMTRIFGVNRANDESERKNRLTGKTFFSYYKDTYSFLKSELEYCANSLSQNPHSVSKVPTLYPVLLVLGKLYPALGESDSQLSSFIPSLKMCAVSPIWKIRVLVAKALVPLISIDNVVSTLKSLFESLPSLDRINFHQNKLHGVLLQISYILQEHPHLPENLKGILSEHLHNWLLKYSYLALQFNNCYSTRAVFLEIILLSFDIGVSFGFAESWQLYRSLLEDLKFSPDDPDREHFLSVATAVIIFGELNICKSENDIEAVIRDKNICFLILDLLRNKQDIVKCTVLQLLIWFLQKSSERSEKEVINDSVEPVFLDGILKCPIISLISKQEIFSKCYEKNLELKQHVLLLIASKFKVSSICEKVWELLCLMPETIDFEWLFAQRRGTALVNKLNYVLDLLKKCDRDDVINAIFLYSSKLAIKLCKAVQDKSKSCNGPPCNQEYMLVLRKWFQLLKQNSEPENCLSMRKIVAVILKNICKESLFNDSKIFGQRSLFLWETLLSLLIDDEPEIKMMAADVVTTMKMITEQSSVQLPVVPIKAIEEMLKLFLKFDVFSVSDYIGIFLNWMLQYDKESFINTGDEHPFDKGELNVFSEDLLVTQIAAEQLSCFLESHSTVSTNLLVSWEKISVWSACSTESKKDFNADQAVDRCVFEISNILWNMDRRGAIFFLLDNQLNQDLSRLCQNLYAIRYLLPWMTKLDVFRDKLVETVNKIKNLDVNIYILNSLLLEIENLL